MTFNNQDISTESYETWLNSININQFISIDFVFTAVSKSFIMIFAINENEIMKKKEKKKKEKRHLLLTKEEDIKLLQLCL